MGDQAEDTAANHTDLDINVQHTSNRRGTASSYMENTSNTDHGADEQTTLCAAPAYTGHRHRLHQVHTEQLSTSWRTACMVRRVGCRKAASADDATGLGLARNRTRRAGGMAKPFLPLTDVPLSTLLTESTPPHSVEHMAFVPAPLSLQQAPAKCFKDRLDC